MNATRRSLFAAGGVGLAGSVLPLTASAAEGAAAPIDEGGVADERVSFSAIDAETERPDGSPPNPDSPARRVGFAIMGLGRLAVENILPAFGESKHAA